MQCMYREKYFCYAVYFYPGKDNEVLEYVDKNINFEIYAAEFG